MSDKKKRGRPRKFESRNSGYYLRLNDEEMRMLVETSKMEDKSMADILRNGLRMSYNLARVKR